jgi:hypothetical protein
MGAQPQRYEISHKNQHILGKNSNIFVIMPVLGYSVAG